MVGSTENHRLVENQAILVKVEAWAPLVLVVSYLQRRGKPNQLGAWPKLLVDQRFVRPFEQCGCTRSIGHTVSAEGGPVRRGGDL